MLERAADLFSVLKSGAVRISLNQGYPLADAARASRPGSATHGWKLDPGAVSAAIPQRRNWHLERWTIPRAI